MLATTSFFVMKRTVILKVLKHPLFRHFYLLWMFLYIAFRDRDYIKNKVLDVRVNEGVPIRCYNVWLAVVFHYWLPKEYFCYKYYIRTKLERQQFVLNWEKNFLAETLNHKDDIRILNNKLLTYNYFKDFYKRMITFADSSKSDFISVIEESLRVNSKVIIKPVMSGSGYGIKLLSLDCLLRGSIHDMLHTESDGIYIIEELIVQDEQMAKFHPCSINSVRISAVRTRVGKLEFHSFMRIGTRDSILDNVKGSIVGNIDVETGTITSAATDAGDIITIHPDTKEKIVGFTIPRWSDAIQIVKQLMMKMPNSRYLSWDLALTHNGWDLIEGNPRGQFYGFQIPEGRGIRDFIKQI